ncbi:sugar O-acyltransferase, sialic acid O-acetyltransferase NeuD family [Longilinea arvoryzae]|uniref:Sugar O-acyltransferase, sialic acid O-acetyltransferase NeuD family n=1 Tax=Longilinea arvoryzae TaxID=360412 RepID=A0A0S7BMY1_9CHLR|nr:acetyltransferase [Longilinea arvoryzae]GAP15878.1 sugar O-acyltransferase, sialic acid O-acetyltransferase NeuD family [Longilinea arvoryzae]
MAESLADQFHTSFDPTAILIFGGGGHGKTLIELVQSLGLYRVVGVIDDVLAAGEHIVGVPVLGGPDMLSDLYKRGVRLAVNGVGGIGNPDVRIKIFEQLAETGFVFPAVVHPTAYVEPSAVLEPGVQVLAQAYVGSDAHIGFGSVINAGVIISHDCRIGNVVNLSPGAMLAGNVTIEDYAQIGMGATINLHLTVGKLARIGNGATVKADVPGESRVYAGTIWPPRI